MQLSLQTQLDMYTYIQSGKISYFKIAEGNIQDFLINKIKEVTKLLMSNQSLFICKPLVCYEGDNFKTIRDYNSSSNQLIYYTLANLNLFPNILNQYDITVSDNLPEDFNLVPESGTPARVQLIQLCKMYLQDKQLEQASKAKGSIDEKIDRESTLAEHTLHRYSRTNFKTLSNRVKKAFGYAQALETDIIVQSKNKVIIIDVKVYSNFVIKKHGELKYTYNSNRFQLNSYIGALRDKYKEKDFTVEGIILHLVSPELWEDTKDLQAANLTIESDRPIHLYIIPDHGLEYILSAYQKIIDNHLAG